MIKRKKVIISLLVLTLLLTSFAFANGSDVEGLTKEEKIVVELGIGNKQYKVNDEIKSLNVGSIIEDGTTYIPLRGVLEELGAKVSWIPGGKQIVIESNEDKIKLTLNSKTAIVNEKEIELSKAPKLVKGSTMIPLRFVAENMGCEVDWNDKEQKITIKATKESLKDDEETPVEEELGEKGEDESKDKETANTAASKSDKKLKYEDWYFNDDFTKVHIKVDGKWETYDNIVDLMRSGDYLVFTNFGACYLTDEFDPYINTPEEYFLDKIRNGLREEVENGQYGTEGFFPRDESISINYVPWQETEFGNDLLEKYHFSRYIHRGQDDVWEFVQNPSNNGYAQEVLQNNKSIEEAKRTLSFEEMKVRIYPGTYRSYDEFKKDAKQRRNTEKYGFNTITYDEFKKLISK